MSEVQNYDHHSKFVAGYHFVLFGLLVLNLGWSAYFAFKHFSISAVVAVLTAFALLMVTFYARVFPLGVQDRVIRLEEQLRLRALLPESHRNRVNEYSIAQLVGLRFASDEELPELAVKVLDEKIDSRDGVKKLIKNWRPDFQRI